MAISKIKQRALKALRSAREKRWKLREISEKTGVSIAALSNIRTGTYPFSDEAALRIIDGCKALGRLPQSNDN